MKSFFEAKKIAVIGASRNREKVGNIVFGNLLENPSLRVFPVNPNAYEVLGRRAYKSVLDIPFVVDLGIIAIPAEFVLGVLEECGKKQIKNVIIISAGFAESGNSGLQEEMLKIAGRYGIKIIGPNVLGIIEPYKKLNASFFRDIPEKGNIGFISQSGAVGTSILDKALEEKLGFSGFISLGNMLNQDFLDALKYFANDRYTEVIMIYIESLKQGTGRDFVELCKQISHRKKIIAINAGKTLEGVKAAKTHTASLASPPKIYSGAFKQAGIIEADSLEEMFVLAKVFSKYKKLGSGACIITNAGGLGVLAVDECVQAGLKIQEIPEQALKELDGFISHGYSRSNPLDILGDALAERYEKVLKILNKYNFCDFFVVIISPQEMTQPLETASMLLQSAKPIFFVLQGGKSFSATKKFLIEHGKIVFEDVSELRVFRKIVN